MRERERETSRKDRQRIYEGRCEKMTENWEEKRLKRNRVKRSERKTETERNIEEGTRKQIGQKKNRQKI